MEFLEGRSLKQLVRDEAPLDPTRAIDITIQILRAARFAHKRGIIHRDIKPHNVIVDDEGRAKVTDFGIARAGASDMTETGAIMGTAQYLSPEQAQGHAVCARSDLYSIGILLYELLTGRVPFDAESAVTIALKQVSEEPVPPRAAQPRGLARARGRRAARAAEGPGAALRRRRRVHRGARAGARRCPPRPDSRSAPAPLTGVYPGARRRRRYEAEPDGAGASAGWLLAAARGAGARPALGVGAWLLLAPEKVAVPKVVGLRPPRPPPQAQQPGLRGHDRERALRRRAGATGSPRQRPGAGRAGRRGLDGHDLRLQRARPGDGARRARLEARRRRAAPARARRASRSTSSEEFSDTRAEGRVIETRAARRDRSSTSAGRSRSSSRAGPRRSRCPTCVERDRDEAERAARGRGLRGRVPRAGGRRGGARHRARAGPGGRRARRARARRSTLTRGQGARGGRRCPTCVGQTPTTRPTRSSDAGLQRPPRERRMSTARRGRRRCSRRIRRGRRAARSGGARDRHRRSASFSARSRRPGDADADRRPRTPG